MTDYFDWEALRAAAVAVSRRAYAPYSHYPVGAAALADDGRVLVGCNVENASYGVGLCAECGLVQLAARDAAAAGWSRFACVDGAGDVIMPCGRCRQLLWEHGGDDCCSTTARGIRPMAEVLPRRLRTRGPGGRRMSSVTERIDAVDVISAKRDRGELTDGQIDWVVDAYTRGVVADEQMSALAMAILLNGMTAREIARWTSAMIATGERMDFSGLSRPTADKHSTGGVGDKITLPLAPLVAACGVAVPQLSGAASATPAAPSTSSSRSRGGAPRCPTRRCWRSCDVGGRGDLRRGRRPRARGQEAVRAARRHRHRRGDPADRLVDHVARRSPRAPARSCSTSRSAPARS